MFLKRIGLASLAIGLGLGAAGCTDGYGGVGVGYASDPYYGGYGDGYYDAGYGGGYGGGYYDGLGGYGGLGYGWYGNYYYPGTGIYVYDNNRRAHRWNDGQRRYWEGRRGNGRPATNWGGFARGNSPAAQNYRQDRRDANQGFRQDRREDRGQLQNGQLTPDQYRGERRDARQDYRQGARQDRREFFQQRGNAGTVTPSAVGTAQPAVNTNRGNGAGQGYRGGRSGGGARFGGGDRGGNRGNRGR